MLPNPASGADPAVCPTFTDPLFKVGDPVWFRINPVSMSQPAIVHAVPLPEQPVPAGSVALPAVVQIRFNSVCYGKSWVETVFVTSLEPRKNRHVPGLDPEPQGGVSDGF